MPTDFVPAALIGCRLYYNNKLSLIMVLSDCDSGVKGALMVVPDRCPEAFQASQKVLFALKEGRGEAGCRGM